MLKQNISLQMRKKWHKMKWSFYISVVRLCENVQAFYQVFWHNYTIKQIVNIYCTYRLIWLKKKKKPVWDTRWTTYGVQNLELIWWWWRFWCHTPDGECSPDICTACSLGVSSFISPDCVWWRWGLGVWVCGELGVWSWERFQHESGQMFKNRPPSHEINNAT